MSEYIDREAASAELSRWAITADRPRTWMNAIEKARKVIEDFPAADVRPVVHGEWYGSGDGYADGHLVIDEWECPCCGKYFPEWDEKPDWNFCPNCGADMRAADSRPYGEDKEG